MLDSTHQRVNSAQQSQVFRVENATTTRLIEHAVVRNCRLHFAHKLAEKTSIWLRLFKSFYWVLLSPSGKRGKHDYKFLLFFRFCSDGRRNWIVSKLRWNFLPSFENVYWLRHRALLWVSNGRLSFKSFLIFETFYRFTFSLWKLDLLKAFFFLESFLESFQFDLHVNDWGYQWSHSYSFLFISSSSWRLILHLSPS